MDINMDLTNFKELKELRNFTTMTFQQKCLNIIASETGMVSSHDDRFGIFLDNSNKRLSLSDLKTDLSFAQITNITAHDYANKDIVVAWSGGIDSSLIVASLYKNKIDFKVTVLHERCKKENPDMYDWVLKNCNIIELNEETYFNDLYDYLKNGGAVISGDPADQLFPSIRYNLLPGVTTQKLLYFLEKGYDTSFDLFNQTYPDENFYNNIKERINFNCNLIADEFSIPKGFSDEVFLFIIQRLMIHDLEIKHFYQLKWLVKFIFKYNKNSQRLATFIKKQFIDNNREPIDFIQYNFFDTPLYQSWAWTNLDKNFETQSLTALTYKMDAKQYIAEVTGLQSQLNLIKIPSL
jgi:hypothetical protein